MRDTIDLAHCLLHSNSGKQVKATGQHVETDPCFNCESSSSCTSMTALVKYLVLSAAPGAYSSTISSDEELPMTTRNLGLLIAVDGDADSADT